MYICSAQVELNLPSRSLKEKRRIIKSLLARARQNFNVSAAEVGLQDVQGAASLGFVVVSSNRPYAYGMLERLEEWIMRERPDVEVVVMEIEQL